MAMMSDIEKVRRLLADVYHRRIIDVSDDEVLIFMRTVEKLGLTLATPIRLF